MGRWAGLALGLLAGCSSSAPAVEGLAFETSRPEAICAGDDLIYFFRDQTSLVRFSPSADVERVVSDAVWGAEPLTPTSISVSLDCAPHPGGPMCSTGIVDVPSDRLSPELFGPDVFPTRAVFDDNFCQATGSGLSCRALSPPWAPALEVPGVSLAKSVGDWLLVLGEARRLGVLAPGASAPVWTDVTLGDAFLLHLAVWDQATRSALVRTGVSGDRRIVRVEEDGSVSDVITSSELEDIEGRFPSGPWYRIAPDGQSLFMTNSSDRDLVRYDLATGQVTVISGRVYATSALWDRHPSSPPYIAYVERSGGSGVGALHLYDVAGEASRRLAKQHDGHIAGDRIAVAAEALYFGAPLGDCTAGGTWPCERHAIARHDLAGGETVELGPEITGHFDLALDEARETLYYLADRGTTRTLEALDLSQPPTSEGELLLEDARTPQACGDCWLFFQERAGPAQDTFRAIRHCPQ